MHLHDLLNMSIADYEIERTRIVQLFFRTPIQEGSIVDRIYFHSLADCLSNDFKRSHIRGTATTINELFESSSIYWKTSTLDGLLFFCELVWNVIAVGQRQTKIFHSAADLANQILQNISIILEKTGHQIVKQRDNLYEIVKKDALVSTAISDLNDRDTACAVLDYIHFGIKGSLAKKRELLVTIGRYVEPLLDDDQLKQQQKDLVSDVGFCLNNLHIRHNNEEGKNAKQFVENMPDAELEDWYDKAYRSMLLLLEQKTQLETHGQIEALKQIAKNEKP